MIVDWHTNIWLEEHLTPATRDHMARSSLGRSTDGSPERFEREILPVADRFIVVACRWPRCGFDVPNYWVADFIKKHSDRAIGFACIDPLENGAPAQLEGAVRELGFRGLKLAPAYQGFDPWAQEAWELYDKANSLGIPVLWHQAAAYPSQSVLEYANPVLLDRIARDFPDLKMILAHFGLPWAAETVQLMRKHKQIFTDISARVYRPWEMYDAFMRAIDYGVTDRILFGSDFPVQTTREALETFRELPSRFAAIGYIPQDLIEEIIHNRPLSLVWEDLE